MNEYYGASTTPMDDYLAHYGVKGMKWGVRRAIASGNSQRLSRQYAKAQKKLAKLEKRAANADKYSKRAKRLAAGAAVAGGLAAAGTGGIAKGLSYGGRAVKGAMKGVGGVMDAAGRAMEDRRGVVGMVGSRVGAAGRAIKRARNNINTTGAVHAVNEWGRSTSAADAARSQLEKLRGTAVNNHASRAYTALNGVSNNTLARIGAGAIGAGLAAGAAKNAYRAATAKKKAAQFKSEMNKAFAGTQYANGGNRQGKKRKRR